MTNRRPRAPILRFGVRSRWSEKAAGDDGVRHRRPIPVIADLRLQVEGETDAEGVERFLQIDAHAARRRTRAAGGSAGAAGAAGGQPESLGVAAEVRVAVLAPDLPTGRDLSFPSRANRAANPSIAPGHCGP